MTFRHWLKYGFEEGGEKEYYVCACVHVCFPEFGWRVTQSCCHILIPVFFHLILLHFKLRWEIARLMFRILYCHLWLYIMPNVYCAHYANILHVWNAQTSCCICETVRNIQQTLNMACHIFRNCSFPTVMENLKISWHFNVDFLKCDGNKLFRFYYYNYYLCIIVSFTSRN